MTRFRNLTRPGQNLVYADVDGNIGYQTTGKVPIRAAGDGSLPVDGSDNTHEWTGYIPFEKLPSVLNPPSGIIGTANGRITPDGYPYSISVEWEAPWRTERIYRVLASGRRFSSADMLALEMDVHSELDHFMADKLVFAAASRQDKSCSLGWARTKAADILRDCERSGQAAMVCPPRCIRIAGLRNFGRADDTFACRGGS